jgi:transposase
MGESAPAGGAAARGVAAALRQVEASARALRDAGQVDESWTLLVSTLEAVLIQNRDLTLLVTKLQRERLGQRSERVDPGQLALLFEALLEQGLAVEVDPAQEAAADAALDQEIADAERQAPRPARRRRKTRPGWQTRGVVQQVHPVDVPAADRTCPTCTRPMAAMGTDVTRRLAYVPGHFVEHVYQRAKYACGVCKEGVTTAPAPPAILPRSAADASVLAHLVVSKFADHTPLHRLHRIYARSGADLPVSTLADWTAAVADRLAPLVERLAARVLDADIVRTDATGLKVLDRQRAAHIERGVLWAYVGDDRDVLFRYAPTADGATGPWMFLAGRTGYVQADASNTFDRLFTGQAAHAIEVGCWAHARRPLVDLRDTDCRVAYPLRLIRRLYRVEHLATIHGVDPAARGQLRQARAAPILDTLRHWVAVTGAAEPPSTALAKAVAYLRNHWQALSRFLDDGRLDLDNTLCERQIRDIAVGRRNYLFAGSHAAARRAATLYSLTRTCAQYGVPPLPYLTDVLQKLATGWPTARLDDLLPHRWVGHDAAPVSSTDLADSSALAHASPARPH